VSDFGEIKREISILSGTLSVLVTDDITNRQSWAKATSMAACIGQEAVDELLAVDAPDKWLLEVFRPDGTRFLGIRPDWTVEMGS
jgi:hypothetical protein